MRWIVFLVAVVPAAVAAQTSTLRFEPGECLVAVTGWGPELRVECGYVIVPEVRERPDGRTLRLAVAILRAKEPSGEPPLVYLHGGPGLNAIASRFLVHAARWPLARHRDIVIYDQRGAGGRATRYPIKDGAMYDIGAIYRDLGIAVP